jgi:hypothetical protein
VSATLEQRIVAGRAAAEVVLAGLRREAAQIGLELPTPAWDSGQFSLQRDAYSGEESLIARWRGDPRQGMIDMRADGRVYAEFDLLAPHQTSGLVRGSHHRLGRSGSAEMRSAPARNAAMT